jgi:glycosyltransferase involved in cell wall biosynthesis
MDSCAISVVIPVFNRQQLGERAVLSACSQAVEGMEIVVVDDGSQPPFQLPDIAEQIPVRLIRLPANQGASTARNVGIKAARGEWIALLDSDDYWLPLTLEPRFAEARRHADSPHGSLIAHAAGFIVKRQANDLSDARIPREADSTGEFACGCWFAPGSTILFRKELFERIGPWDAKLARLEDYDWFLRFAMAGGRLKVWNAIATITEVEGKPPAAVLEAAAHRLLAKYAKPDSADALPRRLARRMRAYLDVERASMRWHCGQPATALLYMARSLLRVPRLTIHLRAFWAAASATIEVVTEAGAVAAAMMGG